jgi:hypothetical protein
MSGVTRSRRKAVRRNIECALFWMKKDRAEGQYGSQSTSDVACSCRASMGTGWSSEEGRE